MGRFESHKNGGFMAETKALGLAGADIKCFRHICAFFHDSQQHYRVLLPFIKEGIQKGDKAFHIVDPELLPDHVRRLNEAGIDVAVAEQSGQLEVRGWGRAHLRGDRFDQKAMLALLEEVLTGARGQGFPLTRWVANMEWGLEDRPGVKDILEYETRLNYVLPNYDDVVICTYDLAKFSAGLVMDMLRTHPAVIIGGILQENPFYVPPDQFLRELSQREDRGVAS
jgi:MEDS: MEthanogen/methylotroph, DcmR Sensory domain